MIRLAARGVRAEWEPGCGHVPVLEIGGAKVLHAAPWRREPAIQADASIPLVDRRLGGTFVCAPFGQDDADGGPPHGLAANAPWTLTRASPSALTARRALARGRIEARIALRDDEPVLYQTHVLELDAPCTFAHHPMIQARAGGRLSASPPEAALTWRAEAPVYAPDQRAEGWTVATPTGPRDLRDLPLAPHEDFVALTGPRTGLAWTALRRTAEADTILILRRAEQLPLTLLWLTNGARQAPPWSGRFRNVIGIEHAVCAGADGTAAALSRSGRVAAEGLPTALRPGRHTIPHAILRLPEPLEIEDVALSDRLTLQTDRGPRTVPFDRSYFA
ncbi:hypothetical protein [Jannaschia seohaensis]|uniref:Galactose mutarotase n=1 Tax=Jannaschia seohaensis TaxID=475081 RepID=A0A2Y9AQ24_9RHOB|nr:hypothetical protein [Jannaschia seohaensis]PWJ18048.1 hypothetical protein BCF38_10535 [Jannaschia seohaensis]SSA46571.1 hypothetical protein SAMN05421539_10535 [Jannaschia seohaensis]